MQSNTKSRSPMQSYEKAAPPMQSYAKSESPMQSYEKLAPPTPPMQSYEKSAPPMQSYAKSESPMQSYAKSESPMQSYEKAAPPMQSYAKSESPIQSYAKPTPPMQSYAKSKSKSKSPMQSYEKEEKLETPKNVTTTTTPEAITHNIVVYPIVKKSNIFKNNGLILTGHTDYINSITFVHSALHGEQNLFSIVSASNDRTIRVWNVYLRDTTVTGSCVSVFDLLAGAASLNLNVIPVRDSENKNNGSYGQLVVGDLYGRVYWLHLMKKDL